MKNDSAHIALKLCEAMRELHQALWRHFQKEFIAIIRDQKIDVTGKDDNEIVPDTHT